MSLSIYPYIFGNDSIAYQYNTVLIANNKYAGRYELLSVDDIYSLVLLGIRQTVPTVKIKGFIYSDNAGVPDALIAVTNEVIGSDVANIINLPFSSPVNLSAGYYWLGIIVDTTVDVYASGYSSGINKYNVDTYSDGPSDPFGSYSNSSYKRIFYAADDAIPMMGISQANGYSVLKSTGGISQAVGYTILKEARLGNNRFTRNPHCISVYQFEDFEIGKDSKGTNDLTLSASPPTAFFGDHKEGNFAVDLDDTNSQYMYIDDANLSSNFPFKSGQSNFDFAICVWVKFNTIVAWDKDHLIFSKGRTAFSLGIIRSSTPQLTLYLDNDGYSVSGTIEQDKWYHISASYDSGSNYMQIRIWDYSADSLLGNYIPNVNVNLVANSNAVQIGSAVDDADYADICLDELVIFNTSITTEDMDAIRQGIYTYSSVKPISMIIV